jgi:prevent-host-death family protein
MAIILFMSNHSVAEARNNLSRLIDRAIEGDSVVITRHGNPVVELRPVQDRGRPMTEADLEWLRANRVGRKRPKLNAAELLSRIRDEEWR